MWGCPHSGSIAIVYQSGQDDDTLSSLNITAPNGSVWHTTDGKGTLADSGSTYAPPNVGAVMKLYYEPGWPPTGQKHIAVVGTFNDGSSHVMLDTIV